MLGGRANHPLSEAVKSRLLPQVCNTYTSKSSRSISANNRAMGLYSQLWRYGVSAGLNEETVGKYILDQGVLEPVMSCLYGGMSWGRVEEGRTRMNSHFEKTMASPKELVIYPQCYIRIKRHGNYCEFYPSKKHKTPIPTLYRTPVLIRGTA
jgi:hypothetical protein